MSAPPPALDQQSASAASLRTHTHGSVRLRREDAMAELASAYADMEAMQATLADSAIYVR